MSVASITEFFDALQSDFLSEDLSQISRYFSFPVVVYSVVGVTVLRTREDLLRIARQYRNVLQSNGIFASRVSQIEQEASSNKR